LRENQGQLVIQWDPRAATTADAFLEITEAEGRTVFPVTAGSASITYPARSGDVEILLSAGIRSGRIHWTSARFVAPVIATAVLHQTPDELRESVEELQNQAQYLRQSIARRSAKVEQLSAEADRLLGPFQ
jgi:hypothetical protein